MEPGQREKELKILDEILGSERAFNNACIEKLLEYARKVDTLHAAIGHGSPKHRAWLEQAIRSHFRGLPIDMEGSES